MVIDFFDHAPVTTAASAYCRHDCKRARRAFILRLGAATLEQQANRFVVSACYLIDPEEKKQA